MPSASARERAWVPLAVVAAAVLAMAILFAGPLATLRDALFGESTPKPGDTTLLEIRKTAELRAATGSYSVPVYFGMDEHGVNKVIPDIFDANSGVAIYQGSIDALIDLRGLTDEIASLSERQRDGVHQINHSVEQASMVTQATAANSEQSAAAAEELSSQAALMLGTIRQFTLQGHRSALALGTMRERGTPNAKRAPVSGRPLHAPSVGA